MRTATENSGRTPDMNDNTTVIADHDNMVVLALMVNEGIETEVEKLPDELDNEGKQLEIGNMNDRKVFDVVKRPNGKISEGFCADKVLIV